MPVLSPFRVTKSVMATRFNDFCSRRVAIFFAIVSSSSSTAAKARWHGASRKKQPRKAGTRTDKTTRRIGLLFLQKTEVFYCTHSDLTRRSRVFASVIRLTGRSKRVNFNAGKYI